MTLPVPPSTLPGRPWSQAAPRLFCPPQKTHSCKAFPLWEEGKGEQGQGFTRVIRDELEAGQRLSRARIRGQELFARS